MMTTTRTTRRRKPISDIVRQLRVSLFDRTTGMVTALLIVVGSFAVVMFAIWWTSQRWPKGSPHSSPPIERLAGGGGNQAPDEVVLDEPMTEEIRTADEPPTETVLEAVTDAVSTRAAELDALQVRSPGKGNTKGRKKGPTPNEDGPETTTEPIPRWDRWEVHYPTESVESYVRQLDWFGIELGAVGGTTRNLDCASGFSTGSPKRSSKLAANEKRLYMTWREGTLVTQDRELLAQAGIETEGRIVLHLFSQGTEDQLAILERDHAGRRDIRSVKKTVFSVRPAGDGFEFYVSDQRYRAFEK